MDSSKQSSEQYTSRSVCSCAGSGDPRRFCTHGYRTGRAAAHLARGDGRHQHRFLAWFCSTHRNRSSSEVSTALRVAWSRPGAADSISGANSERISNTVVRHFMDTLKDAARNPLSRLRNTKGSWFAHEDVNRRAQAAAKAAGIRPEYKLTFWGCMVAGAVSRRCERSLLAQASCHVPGFVCTRFEQLSSKNLDTTPPRSPCTVGYPSGIHSTVASEFKVIPRHVVAQLTVQFRALLMGMTEGFTTLRLQTLLPQEHEPEVVHDAQVGGSKGGTHVPAAQVPCWPTALIIS